MKAWSAGLPQRRQLGCGAITHVGFNLIYLVPSETVGKETYALDLIEAPGAAAPLDMGRKQPYSVGE